METAGRRSATGRGVPTRLRTTCALVVAAALALPAAAHAAASVQLANVNGIDLTLVTSDAGGSNVRVGIGKIVDCGGSPCDEFTANSGTVTAGAGCSPFGSALVRCPHRSVYAAQLGDGIDSLTFDNAGYDGLVAFGGGGPDNLTGSTVCSAGELCQSELHGEAGNDVLIGGSGPDELHGGDGSDELHGGAGADKLYGEGDSDLVLDGGDGNDLVDGGAGDDLLGAISSAGGYESGAGADEWVGGAGNDTLSFGGHPTAVGITLDGQANDGAPGEGDNVHDDIERIIGSSQGDSFVGSAHADRFDGGPGNDTVSGGGGDDTLNGDPGNDTLNGDAGNDTVAGDADDDNVEGGPGTDSLNGDSSGCSVTYCPAGNDTIRARDGERDVVSCGLLFDTVIADAFDLTDGECESVDRGAAVATTTPPPVTAGPLTLAPLKDSRLAASTLKVSKKGVVSIRVSNPNGYPVRVVVTLKSGGRKAGSGTVSLGAGQQKLVSVRLSAAARSSLTKGRRLQLKLTLKTTGPPGTGAHSATSTVTATRSA